MKPDTVESKRQIAEEIIRKLEVFIRNEQAFSQDYYISATEPLIELENLLVYLRLLHRSEVVKMIENERNQLFHWARIASGQKSDDAKTIAEAKGRTKGFATRLVVVLREALAVDVFETEAIQKNKEDSVAEKAAETEQENKDAKREREGMILPKPPEIFQKILWIKKYGRKHWKLVSLAILVVLCIWILSKINLFS